MMNKLIIALGIMLGIISGYVQAAVQLNIDVPVVIGSPPPPAPVIPATPVPALPPLVVDYVGNSTPMYVQAYPGIAFYPRYVVECNCIMEVGFYNGVWFNSLGVGVVFHGNWGMPPEHLRSEYERAPHFEGHREHRQYEGRHDRR